MLSRVSDERAPAAGWLKELQTREDGLWGRVEWTKQAQDYLAAREYRYFSPVLRLDPETRQPLALLHVALTNTPAINHLDPLVAKANEANRARAAQTDKERDMKDQLLKLLGVTGDKPDEEILALADARLKLAGALPGIAESLGLAQEATPSQITGAILAHSGTRSGRYRICPDQCHYSSRLGGFPCLASISWFMCWG